MRLHTKLTLVLASGVVAVTAIIQGLQYWNVTSNVESLATKDMTILREREESNARNVCLSVENAVSGSLERGEMEKFQRLLIEQRQVKGLSEFSLYGRKGTVTHSSDNAVIGRELPAEVRAHFSNSQNEYTTRTPAMIEIYRPNKVTADCVRCHTSWQPGEFGGANYYRFSTAELAAAENQSQATIAAARSRLATNGGLALVAVTLVLASSIFLLVRWLIGHPLGRFTPILTQFASGEGDLTQRIELSKKDEIGVLARMFNGFLSDLDKAVGKAQSTASLVGHAATAQAAAIEETSSAVSQVGTTIRDNAEHARRANTLVQTTATEVQSADRAVVDLATSMTAIQEVSQQVKGLLKDIDEIAVKTHMLAINAAVEAARAGQAGAGFAVVAADVRTLANQSGTAAKRIAELVQGTVDRVHEGTAQVEQVKATFSLVASRSQEAAQLMDEITRRTTEQTTGIDQIVQAIRDIDRTTQQNAVQAEELLRTMSAFETSAA